MSFWTKLFGASDIVDKVSDGIDASFFTPEEKAKHYLSVLKHIEPFKIAQRWIAVLVIAPYVIVWTVCALLLTLSAFMADASQLMEVSDILAQRNNEVLGTPVAIIIGFYFAGGAMEGIINRFKGSK